MMHNNLRRLFLFIISVMLGLILTSLPLPAWAIWIRPLWVVLIQIFWVTRFPQQFGVGVSWLVGLLLDIFNGTVLGEHAFAMVLVAYAAIKIQRYIRFFPFWQQSFCIGVLILIYQIILFLIQGLTGHIIEAWQYWLATLSSLLFWPWVYELLQICLRRYQLNKP